MASVGVNDQQKFYEQRTRELEDDYRARGQRLEQASNKKNEEVQEAADRARDAARDRYEAQKQNELSDSERSKQEAYDRFGRYDKERRETDLKSQEKMNEDLKREFESRTRAGEEQQDRKIKEFRDQYLEKTKSATEAQRDSHARETEELRRQMQDIQLHADDFYKGKAQGTAAAAREYENEHRSELAHIQDSHTAELERERNRGQRAFDSKAGVYAQQSLKREQEFSQQLAGVDSEHKKDLHYLAGAYDADKGKLQEMRDQERKLFEEKVTRAYQDGEDRTRVYGETQAERFRETSERERAQLSQKLSMAESEVQDLKTTGDPNKVSERAADSIRSRMNATHSEQLQRQQEVHEKQKMALQARMRDEYEDRVNQSEKRADTAQTDKTSTISEERRRLSTSYEDLRAQKTQAIDMERDRGEAQNMRLSRQYEKEMENQRGQWDDQLDQVQTDERGRAHDIQYQAELKEKMTEREYHARHQEVVRGYEKQINEQKDVYEDQLKDLRYQLNRANRESDKRVKQALEDQARSYESRIAATEETGKRREQLMAQNHEDQIERLKQTNEFLTKKKG